MQRRGLSFFLILSVLLALTGCSVPSADKATGNVGHDGAEGSSINVWLYAVSAGKADALLLRAGDYVCLIDAGYGRSMGKIRAAMDRMGVEKLDAVFVTHTDDDHVEGLEWLAQSDIPVGAWYASAMFIDVKEEKHPAVKAAAVRGQSVNWLKAGDSIALDGATLDVLAPSMLSEDKDDNNSLVIMLRSIEGNILLAGDIEFPAENRLLAGGASLDCDVLKVANHADDDTTSDAFVQAASPKLAVICTDSAEKPETPDARSVQLLKNAGAKVAVTQECTGGLLVRLSGGEPTVEYVNLPEADQSIKIESVTPGEDTIVLRNDGKEAKSLDGWYIVSEKGGEMFIFPDGTTLQPGARLTIGTNTTETNVDLRWDDKKVIHQSKTDRLTLYDANGMPASSVSNGF